MKIHKRKIETVLAYVRSQTKDVFISAPALYNIFFHMDVMHLNSYGRPICFEKYNIKNGLIVAEYLETLVRKQTLDFKLDKDLLSKSDLLQMDNTLDLHRNFEDFNSFIKSFKPIALLLKEDNVAIPIKNMLYEGTHTEESLEDLEFMLNHAHYGFEKKAFNLPND